MTVRPVTPTLRRMTKLRFVAIATGFAVLGALVVGTPIKAHADASTGSGGLFVSQTGELWNTADGTGGAPTGNVAANSWHSVGVDGVAGIPSSGVSAVTVTFTVTGSAGNGVLHADKDGVTTPNTTVTYLNVLGTTAAKTTGTGTIAVGSDGKIQVQSTTAASIRIDVQGYYTSGATAPGGYVPIQGTKILDTTDGTGIANKTVAQVATGSTTTFVASGTNTVPSSASSVMLSIVEQNPTGSNGNITAYTAGGSRPSTSLSWPAARNYQWASSVALPASTSSVAGKLSIYVGSGGPVDLAVFVIGYFTPTSGTSVGGEFTPGAARVYDSRSPGNSIASQGTRTIQITGVNGVPAVSSAITSVAINLGIVPGSSATGHIQAYADDKPVAGPAQQFYASSTTSSYLVVPVGKDGGITVQNSSTGSIDVVVDVEGWYSSSSGTLESGPSTTGVTGTRPSATTLSFPVSHGVSAKVDVATGNLQVTTGGLSLPGVTSSVPIGAVYNSQSQVYMDDNAGLNYKWFGDFAGTGALSSNSSGVVYTDPTGATWQFTPAAGYDEFISPAGLKDTLVQTPTGYSLTDLTSRQVTTFDTSGNGLTVTDRNGNVTTLNYEDNYGLASIVSGAGPTAARTATIGFDTGSNSYVFSQTSGSSTRSIEYGNDSSGDITSFTDADGNTTSFGYTDGDLTSITSPAGEVTTIGYVSGTDQVSEVDRQNTTSGSAGTSTTRITYPSTGQTLVAGPDTAAGVAVATGPHTTYNIDPTQELVLSATDAMGRSRSATYTANADVKTSTEGTGSTAGTTTGNYGQNSGQSLTSTMAPGGSTTSETYGTTPSTAYLPASTTDDSGNTTNYMYDGAGNQLKTIGAGTAAPTATLTYNTDGTVATALAPGNGSNTTTYAYNSDHQLTSITPVTGSSLGTKAYTYDAFGRVSTESDGAGRTTTYTYDNDDQVLTTAFSDGTHTVTNTYDANGNLTSQVSAGGTITNSYDQLNQLLSTQNTAGGGAQSYGYDKAGNNTTSSDYNGTFTNTFDASGVLTDTAYPKAGGTAHDHYATDDHGRRTDTWLAANTGNTTWSAHETTSYDTSNRVSEVKTYEGPSNTSNTPVLDIQYCYNSASTTSCSTATATDHSKLQWSKNILTSQLTTYSYDTNGRLTGVNESGATTGGNTTYSYAYDARGNRTTATATGTSPSSQSLAYNAANQITTAGYTYDGAGNMTASPGQSFTYNAAEQMTSSTKAGVTTTYTYAGAAQNAVLTASTPGANTYQTTYGKDGEVNTYEVDNDYVEIGHIYSDPTTGQALMLTLTNDSDALYVYDGLGNPLGVISDSSTTDYSYSYDPYGVQILNGTDGGNAEEANPYAFHGGIQDRASGLVKFGLRWYDPTTGTWTQPDTLDAPLDPANANRYAFAGDDPINDLDPTGSISVKDALVCGGSVLLAIGSGLTLLGLGVGEVPSLGTDTPATAVDYLVFIGSAAVALGTC